MVLQTRDAPCHCSVVRHLLRASGLDFWARVEVLACGGQEAQQLRFLAAVFFYPLSGARIRSGRRSYRSW